MKKMNLVTLAGLMTTLVSMTACFHSYDQALCSRATAENLFQADSQLKFPADAVNPEIPVQIEQNIQTRQYLFTVIQGEEKMLVPVTFCQARGQMYAEVEQDDRMPRLLKVEISPWESIKGSLQQRSIVLREIFFSEALVQSLKMDYVKTSKNGVVRLGIANSSQPQNSILDAIDADAKGGVFNLTETRHSK